MSLKCLNVAHQDKPIVAFCIAKYCRKQRLSCIDCLMSEPHGHPNEIKQIDDPRAKEYLQQKGLEYQTMMNHIRFIEQQIQEAFAILRKTIQQQFQPPKEFNTMGTQDFLKSINNMIDLPEKIDLVQGRLDNVVVNLLKIVKQTLEEFSSEEEKIGYDTLRNGQIGKAQEIFDRLITKEPINLLILLNKGDAFQRQGLFPQAMEMYNRILKIDANYPWANVEKQQLQKKL